MELRCIIIDDEAAARERLTRLLKHIGGMLVDAVDGDEVISRVLDVRPQLVFMDVEMPGRTGFDLVREIRDHGADPTFIFVTGYDQYAIKAIRLAAFDFLVKPVDIDELKAALERFRAQKGISANGDIPAAFIEKHGLSTRETEILELLRQNKSSKEIAKLLFLSRHTVDTHRRRLLNKTSKKSTAELLYALRNL